jgi:ribosomal protein S12 methylthiotransferase accessory factor
LRALTEAAQARLTLIAGSRDDIGVARYREGPGRQQDPALADALVRSGGKRFSDVPTFFSQTFHEDVSWELARLRTVGIVEVAIVDLTLPEYRIPVVRVIIPGLEGLCDAAGFIPGTRLRARAS